ncbi:MAG: hypothetical protein AAGB05_04065 [Pseudomonadota bacterium]
MTMTIRALNAQNDGSILEFRPEGGSPRRVVASTRLMVQDTQTIAPDRAIVVMSAFGGVQGEVALLDTASARFLRRTRFAHGAAMRLLHQPGDARVVVLGKTMVSVLDAETLSIKTLWTAAEQIGAEDPDTRTWQLFDSSSLPQQDLRSLGVAPTGAARFALRPTVSAAAWCPGGPLRWLDMATPKIDHGPDHQATFAADLTLFEIDLDTGVLRRRPLWSGYARHYSNRHEDIIAMHADGRRALIRATGLVATPSAPRRSLLRRLFAGPAPDPTTPPPGHLALRTTLWDLDRGTPVGPLDLAHMPVDHIQTDLKPLSRLAAPLRFDTPIDPAPKGPPAPRAEHGPDVLAGIAAGFPLDATWLEDGTIVVLLIGGLLRQIAPDGRVGPLLRPGPLPAFPITPGVARHPLETVRLVAEGPAALRLDGDAAAARVTLPPFRAVPLADGTIVEIPADTLRTKEDWTSAFTIVRKTLLGARPANIRLPNKAPERIVEGLHKMANVVRTRFDEVMTDKFWSPLFVVRGVAFSEEAFCDTLRAARPDGASEALSALILAFTRHYPTLIDAGNEENDRTCLTDCVLTALLLSDRVPTACWRWICRRDADHDPSFFSALGEVVLPVTGVARRDILKLVVRTAVQEFATQNYTSSILQIGAMTQVRDALHRGDVAATDLAVLLHAQTAAQARCGGLSWSSGAGPAGVLSEIARRLDPNQPSESALQAALNRI